MPLTRSLNGINTYEGFKTAYGNTALYNALGGDAGFSDAIASNNENTLNTFMSAVMSANELGGVDAFKANYNTDYLTNSQRLNAVANELWQDRNEVKWYDQYKKDADGNYILNDDGSYQTENVKGTTYDYVKEQLKNEADNNKRIADAEALQLQKDAMNGWAKFGLAMGSIVMNLGAVIADTFKDGVMFVGKLIESTWNKGALKYYMSNQSGYGAGMFSDWMADFDTHYTILRDAYGNSTTIGDMLYGISNTFGEMIPTMLMQYAGTGITKAITAGVTKSLTKAGKTASEIAKVTGAIAKGAKTASTIIGTTYWYNLGVSNIKDYVASSPNADMWQLCLTGFGVAAVQAGVTYVMSKTIGSTLMDKATLGSEFAGSDAIVNAISKPGVGQGFKHYAMAFIKDGYRQAVEEEFQELGQYLVEQASTRLNSKYNAIFEVSSKQFFNAAAMAFLTSFISVSFNYTIQMANRLDDIGDPIIDTKKIQELGGVNALNNDNFKEVFKYNRKGKVKFHKLSVQQSIDIKNILSTINSEAQELETLMTLFDNPRYTEMLETYTNVVKQRGDAFRKMNELKKVYEKTKSERHAALLDYQQAIRDEATFGKFDITQYERQKLKEREAKPVSPKTISGKFKETTRGINTRNRSIYGSEDYQARTESARIRLEEANRVEAEAVRNYHNAFKNYLDLKEEVNTDYKKLKGTNIDITNEYINNLKRKQRNQLRMRLTTLVNAAEVLSQFYNTMGDKSFQSSIKYLNDLNNGRESQLRIHNAGGYVKYMNRLIGNIQMRYEHKAWTKLLKYMQENGIDNAVALASADVKANNIVKAIDKTEENKSKATQELKKKRDNAEQDAYKKVNAIATEVETEQTNNANRINAAQAKFQKQGTIINVSADETGNVDVRPGETIYTNYKELSAQEAARHQAEAEEKMKTAQKIYDVFEIIEQGNKQDNTEVIIAEDGKSVILEDLQEAGVDANGKRRVIVLPLTLVVGNKSIQDIVKIAAQRRIVYDMLDSDIVQKLLPKFKEVFNLVYGIPEYHLQKENNAEFSEYFNNTVTDETIITNLLFNKQFIGLCMFAANEEMIQFIATLPDMFEAYANKAATKEDGKALAAITEESIEEIKLDVNEAILDYYIYAGSYTANSMDIGEIKEFDVFNEKYFTKEKQNDLKNRYIVSSKPTDRWSEEYLNGTMNYYRWLFRGTAIYINPNTNIVIAGTQLHPGTQTFEREYQMLLQKQLSALYSSNAANKIGFLKNPSFVATQFSYWCDSNNLIPGDIQNFFRTEKLSDLHADDALLEKIAEFNGCSVNELVGAQAIHWIENNLFNYSGITITYDSYSDVLLLTGSETEDLRFANTSSGRVLAQSLVLRPDLMQGLFSEFINSTTRDDNGVNNRINFMKWIRINHPELSDVVKAINALSDKGFEVSFAPTNNAQKYVHYYIDANVGLDVFTTSTINDLIYHPDLLNAETKDAIKAQYGSVTPTTTFYYLKRDIFLKTANTENPVTIMEMGNNRFAFVSMANSTSMMQLGYASQFSKYTQASATEKPFVAVKTKDKNGKNKTTAKKSFNDRYTMDVMYIPELNYTDDDGNLVYLVSPSDVHDKSKAYKKGCTTYRIDAFIADDLITTSELRDMQVIIEHGKNGTKSTRVTDVNGNTGYGYYDPSTNTIHIPDIVPVDTILHEFIHGLERANMTSLNERFDVPPANIFDQYEIATVDSDKNVFVGDDSDVVEFAKDILRHSTNGLVVWKKMTGDDTATLDENYSGSIDVELAELIVATYIYSACNQELVVRGNSYAVVDAMAPNVVKSMVTTKDGRKAVFTIYTPWGTTNSFLRKNDAQQVNNFSLPSGGDDTCVGVTTEFEAAFDTTYKDSTLYNDVNTEDINITDDINARDSMLVRCNNTLDEVYQNYTERQQEAFRVLSHTYTDLTNTHYKDINNHFFDVVGQDEQLRNLSLTKLYYKLGYNTKGTMQDFLNADIPVIVFNKAVNKYTGILIADNIDEAIANICGNYSRRNIVDDLKSIGISTVKPKDIVFVADNNNAVTTPSAIKDVTYYDVDHFIDNGTNYAKSKAPIKIVTNEYNGDKNITVHTSLTEGDSYNASFNSVRDKIVVYDNTYKCKADRVIIDTPNNTLLYTHDLNDSTTYVNTQRLDTSNNIYASYLFGGAEPDSCFDIKTSTITFTDGTVDSHCTLIPHNQVTEEGNIRASNGKIYTIDDIADIKNDAEPVEPRFNDVYDTVPGDTPIEDGLDTQLNDKENLGELIAADDFYQKFNDADISDQETIVSTLKQEIKNLQKVLKDSPTEDGYNQLFKLQTRLINVLLYTVRSDMFGSNEFQAFLFNHTDSSIDYFDMVKEYMSDDITRLQYDSPLYKFVNEIISSKTLTYTQFNGMLRSRNVDELRLIGKYLYDYCTWSSDVSDGFYAMYALTADAIMNKSIYNFSYNEFANRLLLLDSNNLNRQLHSLDVHSLMTLISTLEDLTDRHPEMQRLYDAAQMAYRNATKTYPVDKTVLNSNYGMQDVIARNNADNPESFIIPPTGVLSESDTEISNWTNDEVNTLRDLQNSVARNGNSSTLMHMIIVESAESVYNSVSNADGKKINGWLNIINSIAYYNATSTFNDNIRRKVELVEDAIRYKAANIIITYLTTTKIITDIDAIQAELIMMATMSDSKLADTFNAYTFNDDKLWYYLCETKILREKIKGISAINTDLDLALYNVEHSITNEITNRTNEGEEVSFELANGAKLKLLEDDELKENREIRKQIRSTQRQTVGKQGHGVFNRKTAKIEGIQNTETVDVLTGNSWKAKFDKNGKPVYAVAKKKYAGTNIEKLHFGDKVGKQETLQMSPEMQEFIVSTRLEPDEDHKNDYMSPELKDFIIQVNTDPSRRGVFDYDDLIEYIRSNDFDYINDYTFNQIKKYFFMFDDVKSLEDLKDLSTRVEMFWTVSCILRMPSEQTDIDYADLNDMKLTSVKEIDDYAQIIIDNNPDLYTKIYNQRSDFNIARGNLRVQILNNYDGTIDSMRRIYNIACWLALNSEWINIPGEKPTVSLEETKGGTKDNDSNRTLEETVSNKTKEDIEAEIFEALSSSDDTKMHEILDFRTREFANNNPDYNATKKFMNELEKELEKLIDDDYHKFEETYAAMILERDAGLQPSVAELRAKAAVAANTDEENRTLNSLRNSIKNRVAWLKDNLTRAEYMKMVELYPEYFDENGEFKDTFYRGYRTKVQQGNEEVEVYHHRTRGELREVLNNLNALKEEAKINSFKSVKRLKELQAIKNAKKTADAKELRELRAENKKLHKRVDGIDANNKEYFLSFTVNEDEAVPKAMVDILKTSIEDSSTYKRTVQFNENDDTQTIAMSVHDFCMKNQSTFDKMTNNQKIDIIGYLYNHLGTPDGTADAVKIYNVVTLWILAYFKSEVNNGTIRLDAEELKMLDTAYGNRASMYGAGLHAVNDAIAEMHLDSKTVENALQAAGIDYTETQVDTITTILDTPIGKSCTDTFFTAHHLDKTKVKKWDNLGQVTMTKDLKQALLTSSIQDLTKTALEGVHNRKKYTRVMNSILAFEQACLMSWPGTWLRNLTSNAILKECNQLGDWIGKGFTSIPGVKGKVEKGKEAIKAKGIRGTFIYNITGTKPTPATKDAVQRFMNTPMYTDEKGNVVTLYKSVENGMTRYNDVMFNKSGKRSLSSATTLSELIMESISINVFNYHRFDSMSDSKTKQQIGKTLNNVANWMFKMLSDDPFIKRTTTYLFERMCTERGIIPSRISINDSECINIFAEAYTQAAYQYVHRTSFLKKMESTLKSQSFGGEMGWFVLKQFMPFMNATWNWGVEALNYSPYGMVKGITQIFRLEKTFDKNTVRYENVHGTPSPNFTLYNARQTLGKGVIGTLLMGFGAALAACGAIALDDKDDKLKLYVGGNTYIDVSSVFGSSSFLAGAAIVWDIFKADDDMSTGAKLWSSFDSCLSYLFEDTLFNDLYNSFRYNTSVGDWLTYNFFNMFGNFIPNAWKQVMSLTYTYEPQYSSGILGQLERLGTKLLPAQIVPGVEKQYDPYTGEVVYNYKAAWFTKLWNSISPIDIAPYKVSDIEMTAISLGIKKSQLTGNYDDIGKLTNKQKSILNQMYGQLNKQELTKLINGKLSVRVENEDGTYSTLKWNRMTDTQKASAITSIMSKNSTYAKVYVFTSAMGGKYYASDSEYTILKSYGIIGNVYRETGKLRGFVKS